MKILIDFMNLNSERYCKFELWRNDPWVADVPLSRMLRALELSQCPCLRFCRPTYWSQRPYHGSEVIQDRPYYTPVCVFSTLLGKQSTIGLTHRHSPTPSSKALETDSYVSLMPYQELDSYSV